jgi:hypothetical protein
MARVRSATTERTRPASGGLFAEVRVMVTVATPVMLSTGLMDIDRGRTGYRGDGHYGRNGEEKDRQKS